MTPDHHECQHKQPARSCPICAEVAAVRARRDELRTSLEEKVAAQEREIARLRSLLDEIHRGESTAPRAPKRYDAAAQSCQIPGCVRIAGHMNFHCTNEAIAKRVDAAAQEREDA